MQVLVVGVANTCRSPFAERLLAVWADEALGEAAREVQLLSMGVTAVADLPMDPRSQRALVAHGGNAEGFRSRVFERVAAEESAIVLTVTRRVRTAVLERAPRIMRRSFTLAEASWLVGAVDLDGLTELPLAGRAEELARRMNDGRTHKHGPRHHDLPNPAGRRRGVHMRVSRQLAAMMRPLADVLLAEPLLPNVVQDLPGGAAAPSVGSPARPALSVDRPTAART